MKTTITLRKREVSALLSMHITGKIGNELFYVVDADQAKALAVLTGQKTITERNIGALKQLGYTITYV